MMNRSESRVGSRIRPLLARRLREREPDWLAGDRSCDSVFESVAGCSASNKEKVFNLIQPAFHG